MSESHSAVSLEVQDLSKSFGSQQVLKQVSFKVEPGEIFSIMGPSGSGKSVLLRQMAGLDRPDSGQVLINGKDVLDSRTREEVRIGLVFQAGALFNSMSIYDNLALYPREHRLFDEDTIRQKVERALSILSLDNAGHKRPAELSGGMRKRVAVARVIVMEPQLILYDEPTSELDPIMAATISELIATVNKEEQATTIVVTHDRQLAMGISDRVAILMNGEIRCLQTPDKLTEAACDATVEEFLNPELDLENPRFRKSETAS